MRPEEAPNIVFHVVCGTQNQYNVVFYNVWGPQEVPEKPQKDFRWITPDFGRISTPL